MSLSRGGALLLALGTIASAGCGRGESRASAGASDAAKSTPAAAASPSTARPVPSPEGWKTGSTDASQKAAFDPDAEYDKGAALAAARRFADARQVFEEAARQAPKDGSLAAAVAIFDDLAANRISEDVVQRLFQAGQDANAERWAEASRRRRRSDPARTGLRACARPARHALAPAGQARGRAQGVRPGPEARPGVRGRLFQSRRGVCGAAQVRLGHRGLHARDRAPA